MSRPAITRLPLAALALALLLAGTAAASAAPLRAGHAASAATSGAGVAAHLSAAWRWWAGLWSSHVTPARGQEGSGVDPDGRPAGAEALPGYSVITGAEGSGVDPNGSR